MQRQRAGGKAAGTRVSNPRHRTVRPSRRLGVQAVCPRVWAKCYIFRSTEQISVDDYFVFREFIYI